MEPNPSRPLWDVKQSAELAVVEVVPVAPADDVAVDARQAREGAVHVGVPDHLVRGPAVPELAGSPAASSGSGMGRAAIRRASLRAIVATQGWGRSGVRQLS